MDASAGPANARHQVPETTTRRLHPRSPRERSRQLLASSVSNMIHCTSMLSTAATKQSPKHHASCIIIPRRIRFTRMPRPASPSPHIPTPQQSIAAHVLERSIACKPECFDSSFASLLTSSSDSLSAVSQKKSWFSLMTAGHEHFNASNNRSNSGGVGPVSRPCSRSSCLPVDFCGCWPPPAAARRCLGGIGVYVVVSK